MALMMAVVPLLGRHAAAPAARIIMAEAGPLIRAAFFEKLRLAAERPLALPGVEVRKSCVVTQIRKEAVQFGSERMESGTILWAAGAGALPLGKYFEALCDRGGRVIAEPRLTLPGRPEVCVIGDLASFATRAAIQQKRRNCRLRMVAALGNAGVAVMALRCHLVSDRIQSRLIVMFLWAWAYGSYQGSVRLITGIHPR
jgi:hypothetical protein